MKRSSPGASGRPQLPRRRRGCPAAPVSGERLPSRFARRRGLLASAPPCPRMPRARATLQPPEWPRPGGNGPALRGDRAPRLVFVAVTVDATAAALEAQRRTSTHSPACCARSYFATPETLGGR
eukprot:1221592-Pyramimonas_sp.AAC.1